MKKEQTIFENETYEVTKRVVKFGTFFAGHVKNNQYGDWTTMKAKKGLSDKEMVDLVISKLNPEYDARTHGINLTARLQKVEEMIIQRIQA